MFKKLYAELDIKCEPVAVPVQTFEQVAATVDEHKEGPGKGVGTHIRTHQPAQGVEGLSHVARDPVEIDVGRGGQGQHGLSTPGA